MSAEERAFLAWVRETAVPLDLSSPERSASALARFDPLLEGKRLAFLGEANHWVHEKLPLRECFVRWLAARGFGRVGEELAFSDGRELDAYLADGDETRLGRIVTWGYRGYAREDRDDRPSGILAEATQHQPEAELAAEHGRFLRTLREVRCDGEPLRYFGFDVDYAPGAGVRWVEAALARGRGEALRALRTAVTPVPGEALASEIARLEKAWRSSEATRRELDATLGAVECAALRRAIRTLWLSCEYMRLANAAPSYEALGPALALRERIMAEQVQDALAAPGMPEHTVLMSHALHLAKDDRRFETSVGASGPGGDGAHALGTQLHDRYGEEVVGIWMLEDHGEDARPIPGPKRIRSVRGSINALLARAEGLGQAFALPTRSLDPRAALLTRECTWITMYDNHVRGILPEQTDLIAFVPRVTPLRPHQSPKRARHRG